MKLRNTIKSKITFSKTTILFALLTVLIFNNNLKRWENSKSVIAWDVISYYAYLPAAFIYHDITLKFKDNYKGEKKFTIWAKKTETGNYVLKTSMGAAIMYSPFFAFGNIYAENFGYNTGGYSEPYKIAIILSSVFYFLMGLIFIRKILKKYFSETVTGLALTAIAFGTNIIWYTSGEASMPHNQSFMLISIFIFYSIKWHETQNLKNTLIIGFTIGLISLIRPTNIIIALFFILFDFKKLSETKERILLFLKNYKYILLIILLIFIVWTPQFIYWKTVTGKYLYYSYGSEEGFFFNNPQIINGLFSFRKGLFIYSPIMLFSFFGLFSLYKEQRKLFWAIITFFIINIYIIFSWWCWWYGGSFGQRALIDSIAISAIPMAAAFNFFIKKGKITKSIFITIFSIFTLYGIYTTHLYKTGAIHWDGMTKEAFFDSFGRLKPSKKFNSLIKHPDYDAAHKGKEKY